MAKKKIVIVGGGASGMVAAIIAARNGAKVTVLEKNNKLGKKVLATGNGRCNLSNCHVEASRYHSRSIDSIKPLLELFPVKDVCSFFQSIGVPVKELDEGKLYPASLQSNAVVNALRITMEELGVTVEYNQYVRSISKKKGRFRIETAVRTFYGSDVFIATGGKSCKDLGSDGSGYLLATSFGHSIIEPRKSIVQLRSDFPYLKHLKGLKWNASIQLFKGEDLVRTEAGELLFTDYGVSGPPVLQLSTMTTDDQDGKMHLSVDLMPDYTAEQLDKELLALIQQSPKRKNKDVLIGMINNKLIQPLLKESCIEHEGMATNITKAQRCQLVRNLKGMIIPITDTYLWNQAQVTAGGVAMNELNILTGESCLVKGLYFPGEIQDVDGDCGGYNLHYAWISAMAAATDCTRKEEK